MYELTLNAADLYVKAARFLSDKDGPIRLERLSGYLGAGEWSSLSHAARGAVAKAAARCGFARHEWPYWRRAAAKVIHPDVLEKLHAWLPSAPSPLAMETVYEECLGVSWASVDREDKRLVSRALSDLGWSAIATWPLWRRQ